MTLTGDDLEMSFPWEQATQDRCLGMIRFSLREWPFEFRVKLSIASLLKVALTSIILTLAWQRPVDSAGMDSKTFLLPWTISKIYRDSLFPSPVVSI